MYVYPNTNNVNKLILLPKP